MGHAGEALTLWKGVVGALASGGHDPREIPRWQTPAACGWGAHAEARSRHCCGGRNQRHHLPPGGTLTLSSTGLMTPREVHRHWGDAATLLAGPLQGGNHRQFRVRGTSLLMGAQGTLPRVLTSPSWLMSFERHIMRCTRVSFSIRTSGSGQHLTQLEKGLGWE